MTNMSIPQTILSNLNTTIDNQREVSRRSMVPCPYHASHVLDVVEAYLTAYEVAGQDTATMPLATRLSEMLVGMVAWLCDLERFGTTEPSEGYVDSASEVVRRVYAITESLDEGSYGIDACDRFNAFMVASEEF